MTRYNLSAIIISMGIEKRKKMTKSKTPEERMQDAMAYIQAKSGYVEFKSHNAIIADNLEEFLAKAAEQDKNEK